MLNKIRFTVSIFKIAKPSYSKCERYIIVDEKTNEDNQMYFNTTLQNMLSKICEQ